MAVNQFNNCNFVISDDSAKLLSEKKENVFIWCNADEFVKKHSKNFFVNYFNNFLFFSFFFFFEISVPTYFTFLDLKGFYSGMFISEVEEAEYCGLGTVSQREVGKK